jgi:hypothetical protein
MEARTKRLVISVTPKEKQLLKMLADYEGRLSLTATVRHILMDAVRLRGLDTGDRTDTPDCVFPDWRGAKTK